MSNIDVGIDSAAGIPSGVPVPLQLVNLRTRRAFTAVAEAGEVTRLEVDDGPCFIQAVLEDGRLLTADADATGGGSTVWLAPSAGGRATPARTPVAAEELQPELVERAWYASVWARLWKRVPDSWVTVNVEPHDISVDATSVRWRLTLPNETLHGLEVGGQHIPRRTLILPPADTVDVTLAHTTGSETGGFGGGYALTARTRDEHAEALLAYLAAGQLDAAEGIANKYLKRAERMLEEKSTNPVGAAIGGYYLLQTQAIDRMHNWPSRLARFSWFPDAAVVRIGQLILASDPDRRELVTLVDQAVRAGLPVYTDGLRWLYRAVELLLADEPADAAHLRAAHTVLREYSIAADWDSTLTSFRGDPTMPIVKEEKGRPAGAPALSLLPLTNSERTGASGFTPLSLDPADWTMLAAPGTNPVMQRLDSILETVGGYGLYCYTKQQFGDFSLWLEWRETASGDISGVYLRIPDPASPDALYQANVQGHKVQIDDLGADTPQGQGIHRTGAIYGLQAPTSIPVAPVGEWNTYLIEATGPRIRVTLNGQLINDFTSDRRPAGFLALEVHGFPSKVAFRNLGVR